MESNLFDYEKLKESEKFGIKQYRDSVYKGELLNGKRSGLGTCFYRT